MSKKIFEILHELNQMDARDDTSYVRVSNYVEEIEYNSRGANLYIGVPTDVANDLAKNKVIILCVAIDKDKFMELKQSIV